MKIIKSTDIDKIFPLVAKAFGYDKEAYLVKDLLSDKSAEPILSLVAEKNGEYIGHILFTKCTLVEHDNYPLMHILAPLAILPEYQKQGIGGLLIKEGHRILKEMGTELVFVLGHMDYYPRFGYLPDAKSYGYSAPYLIPEEYKNAWMLQSLKDDELPKVKGKVMCSNELNKEQHWRE